ncbi:hypothetical protein M0804_004612 [Polistes exclamans]|nr:hypothetical protein M0804_004612 [Polistes exclamans]
MCFGQTCLCLQFSRNNLVKIKSIYTKLKDKDDKLEQSNLVYKIPCECEKCYVGQTKQKLKKRLDQHRNDSKPTNAQKTNTTALAEHHFKTGHIFKFDETKILDKEDNCSCLDPERGIARGIAVKAPSSTKLTSVLHVASNSGEHPHVTAVASDWPLLDLAYSITLAPL